MLRKSINYLFMLPTGVNDVSKIRKTLKLFYLKEAGWNLSRFHICFYWPEVFWLGKIFLILSAFPQCPTKTCVRMGNIFEVPKESSLCLKDMAELRAERGPSGRGGRCLRINFSNILRILSSFILTSAIWEIKCGSGEHYMIFLSHT